jgi:hypothetical protein
MRKRSQSGATDEPEVLNLSNCCWLHGTACTREIPCPPINPAHTASIIHPTRLCLSQAYEHHHRWTKLRRQLLPVAAANTCVEHLRKAIHLKACTRFITWCTVFLCDHTHTDI